MRTICSLPFTAEDLPHLRHCLRGIGSLSGLPPLARARWLTALSLAARQVVQAGDATLTLLVDDSPPIGKGPALVAQVSPAARPTEGSRGWPAGSSVMERLQGLVDHVFLQTVEEQGGVLTLVSSVPDSARGSLDGALREQIEQLRQQPPLAGPDALAQHDEEVAALLRAAQVELEGLRRAHAEALNTLAHDIRSPLLTLNLSLEMLRIKPHSPAELEERREVMKRQADQLKALASSLRQAAPSEPPADRVGGDIAAP